MPPVKEYSPGTFSWIDLGTTDLDAALKFYGAIFGWTFAQGGDPSHPYWLAQLNGQDICGLHGLMPEQQQQGIPPHWLSYVTCGNVGDSSALAAKLGGTVVMGPMDVMDKGRMSIVMDPTGAMFALWQPLSHIGTHIVGEPGTPCWNELMTKDIAKATAFYTALFNWGTKVMPMPGMDYTMATEGDVSRAGMMGITKEMGPMPSNWGVYFAVADCDASVRKIEAAGGTVCQPPMDVPGVGRMAALTDPQGAYFSIIHLGGGAS